MGEGAGRRGRAGSGSGAGVGCDSLLGWRGGGGFTRTGPAQEGSGGGEKEKASGPARGEKKWSWAKSEERKGSERKFLLFFQINFENQFQFKFPILFETLININIHKIIYSGINAPTCCYFTINFKFMRNLFIYLFFYIS